MLEIPEGLEEEILEATKEGEITLWTERIAQLAEAAGILVAGVNWSGSPATVANRVASAAANHMVVDKLLELMSKE